MNRAAIRRALVMSNGYLAESPMVNPPRSDAAELLIRRIGPRHFLAGSDWPYNGVDLADYYGRVYPQLPLTKEEWAIIRSNVAPYAR